jgi:hypothetical protein
MPVIPNNDSLINKIDILKKDKAILVRRIVELEQKLQHHSLNPIELRDVHNIAPVDYDLEHLHDYDRNLLIDIIKYLHTKLFNNKNNQQTDVI